MCMLYLLDRFASNERKEVSLFTINVPSKFNRKAPTPSYLVKWDCSKWLPLMSQAAGIEPLTQMAIRYSYYFNVYM